LSILVSVVLSSVAAVMIFAALRNMQGQQSDEKSTHASDGAA
jgi:type II secretory pathway component PulJ